MIDVIMMIHPAGKRGTGGGGVRRGGDKMAKSLDAEPVRARHTADVWFPRHYQPPIRFQSWARCRVTGAHPCHPCVHEQHVGGQELIPDPPENTAGCP